MTQEKLSQEDVDALLSKLRGQTGDRGDGETQKKRTVFPYNFKSQKKMNRGQFLLLESLHKRFLRNIESSLTNLLNAPVIATLASTTELSFGEYAESGSSPTCIYVLNMSNGLGKVIMEIDPDFVFFLIDKVLGGSGTARVSLNRELSAIEEKIMTKILNIFLTDLKDAWSVVERLVFKVDSFYTQFDYVNVIGHSDKIVLVSSDLKVGENEVGFLNLCLPITAVQPILLRGHAPESQTTAAPTIETSARQRRLLLSQVTKSTVPLRIILGTARVKVSELLGMEEGDVVILDSEINKPLDMFVGNLKVYKCQPVKKEGFVNVAISGILHNENYPV